jgi:hypothetical protein
VLILRKTTGDSKRGGIGNALASPSPLPILLFLGFKLWL